MPELFKLCSGSKVQQAKSNQVHKIICLIEFAPALAAGNWRLRKPEVQKQTNKKTLDQR